MSKKCTHDRVISLEKVTIGYVCLRENGKYRVDERIDIPSTDDHVIEVTCEDCGERLDKVKFWEKVV